jgi:hypothetical protein
MKEDKIQQQIIGYLSFMARKYNFIFFAPLPESAMTAMTRCRASVKDKAITKNHMSKMGFLPGVSDIIIFHHEKAYCMELKQKDTDTKKFVQQKDQILFENNCKKTGIPYEVVRSLDGAINQLHLWGIISE